MGNHVLRIGEISLAMAQELREQVHKGHDLACLQSLFGVVLFFFGAVRCPEIFVFLWIMESHCL